MSAPKIQLTAVIMDVLDVRTSSQLSADLRSPAGVAASGTASRSWYSSASSRVNKSALPSRTAAMARS
jgi:hypothetical protein